MDSRTFIIKTKEQSELLHQVVQACQSLLPNSFIKEYLDSRVYIPQQLEFQFGFFPPSSELEFLFSKVSQEILEKLGLFYNKSGYFDKHNLIFPVKDDYGQIIGLVGRASSPDVVKYKYTKDFPRSFVLYALHKAKAAIWKKKYAILVEGQLDCLTSQAHGLETTVASGGVDFNYYQLYLLKKYGAKKIYLILDSDSAGQMAAEKIMKKFSQFMDFQIISLPKEYKDIDLFLRAGNNPLLLSKDLN